MLDAPENLIRKVDQLLEAARDLDRELDDVYGILLGLDAEKRWDGYIIGSDSPLTVASANAGFLRDELDRLAMDLRTIPVADL